MKSPKPARTMTKAEIAEIFDVSIPTVNAWVRRGCPYVKRGDKTTPWQFRFVGVAEWRYSRDVSENLTGCAPVLDNPDDMSPRDRRYWYEGEKIKREVEERMRNLITAEEYRAEKARILGHLIPFAEALPDRLAHMLPPDALAVAREECSAMVARLREQC